MQSTSKVVVSVSPYRPQMSVILALVAVAAAATTLLVLAEHAEASHFRGGTLYAIPDLASKDNLGVNVQGRQAWRAETRTCANNGDICYNEGTLRITDSMGTVVTDTQTGTACSWSSDRLYIKQMARNQDQNWVYGKLSDPSGNENFHCNLPTALDSKGQPWFLLWDSCCRMQGSDSYGNYHINNHDKSELLQATIDLVDKADNPPKPIVPPITLCRYATLCQVKLPFTDLDAGESHDYVFSTPAQAGDPSFVQPGPCGECATPPRAYLDQNRKALMWDSTGATYYGDPSRTFYSTQVMFRDSRERVPMDWLIWLVDPNANLPLWDVPYTPCEQSVFVIQGFHVSLPLRAYSTDPSRTVTIIPFEYPAGSSTTVEDGNPATGTFNWDTAGVPQGDYLAAFLVQDDNGYSGETCVIRFRISPPPVPDFGWQFDGQPVDQPGNTFEMNTFEDRTVLTDAAGMSTGFSWSFGDVASPTLGTGHAPTHSYQDGLSKAYYPAGKPYYTCMTLTLSFTYTSDTWTGEVCKNVGVWNRAPTPTIQVIGTPGTQSVRFHDVGRDVDGIVLERNWDFGDGEEGHGAAVEHRFTSAGTFTVCLTDLDDDQDSGKACRLVQVFDPNSEEDADQDGVEDRQDNCPNAPNTDQLDSDANGLGDACDSVTGEGPGIPGSDPLDAPTADRDNDGIANQQDNCPNFPNADQADVDHDRIGDRCDPDADGDQVLDFSSDLRTKVDNCPLVANPDQLDTNGNGVGDACDLQVGVTKSGLAGAGGSNAAGTVGGSAVEKAGFVQGWPFLTGVVAFGALLVALGALWVVRRWK